LEGNEFLEVYVECPLEECEKRDPKGLYKKARSGEIRDFTGIDSPYESPANPELTINTSTQSVEECVQTVIEYLANRKFI
ncbi:adenylyl-sulfate kinase, partial [Priestia megaterium]